MRDDAGELRQLKVTGDAEEDARAALRRAGAPLTTRGVASLTGSSTLVEAADAWLVQANARAGAGSVAQAAVHSREMLELLLDFAVGEGVLNSNPMGVAARDGTPSRLRDPGTHREIASWTDRTSPRRASARSGTGARATLERARDLNRRQGVRGSIQRPPPGCGSRTVSHAAPDVSLGTGGSSKPKRHCACDGCLRRLG